MHGVELVVQINQPRDNALAKRPQDWLRDSHIRLDSLASQDTEEKSVLSALSSVFRVSGSSQETIIERRAAAASHLRDDGSPISEGNLHYDAKGFLSDTSAQADPL